VRKLKAAGYQEQRQAELGTSADSE